VTELVGIFVGGQSTRMLGQPKGLLTAPHSSLTLVERLAGVVRQALPDAALVFVGAHPAYARLGVPQIADAPHDGAGPLAGLAALCREATRLAKPEALCLACDLPYLEAELLTRLAHHALGHAAVAARVDDRWQPFFARYQVRQATPVVEALLVSARRGLYGVLDGLAACELPLSVADARQLRDWDTPADVSEDA
jgi:molybdopterin-guanine dinucleotide biosynthesis protein A